MKTYLYRNLNDTKRVQITRTEEDWYYIVYFKNSPRYHEGWFLRKKDAKLCASRFTGDLYSLPKTNEEFVGWDGDGKARWEPSKTQDSAMLLS
jgi:hypothetical protein